jgi:ubiquitin-conjugating enzyme E2 variant
MASTDHVEGLVAKPGYKRAVEVVSVSAFLGSFAWALARVAPHALPLAPWLLVAAVLALVSADVISGVVHWAADTWGSSDWPVLGTLLLRPFRAHHVDPLSITRHDFWETNGHNALATLPLALAGVWMPLDSVGARLSATFVSFLALALFLTNQVHKLAHEPDPGPFARALQRARVILPPEDHARHHAAPYLCAYCITLGWTNGVLDRLRVFGRLERAITALTGAEPRAEDARLAAVARREG